MAKPDFERKTPSPDKGNKQKVVVVGSGPMEGFGDTPASLNLLNKYKPGKNTGIEIFDAIGEPFFIPQLPKEKSL